MNKRDRSRDNMLTTVTLLLDEYSDVLAGDPDLTAAEQERQNHIALQRIAARKALEPTKGNTKLKEDEKALFIKELMKPVGRVQAWAARFAKGDVAAQLKVVPSDLTNTPDGELAEKAENLMTVMRGVIAQVPTVPTARLDALDDQLDALEPRLGSPRLLIVDRGASGDESTREIRAAMTVLEEQHDRIIRSFEIASPATPAEQRQRDLFDRWAGAREIVDAATNHEDPPAGGGGPPPVNP